MLSTVAPAAESGNRNVVSARAAAPPTPKEGREPATLGLPPGSEQLALDDGSSEYSIGVTNQQRTIGSQAVFLNRFVPSADQLPLTIDTVSILFPTTDQFGETGLFPQQTFQILVYLDPNATGDPHDLTLVERVTFDLEPSNTVFQNVTLDESVTVTSGAVYIGFTDPYVAVAHDPIFPAAVDTDTQVNASFAFFNLTAGDDFDGENLAAAGSGASPIAGTFLIRAFFTTGGAISLCWDPAAGDGAPPTNNRVCTPGSKCGEYGEVGTAAVRDAPTGYNIYRGTSPNVQPTASNFFSSVPASRTTVDSGVAPGGSFFVVTATYADGESNASNEVGVRPATVTSVKVKSTKVTAKGVGFTAQVQVFVDGIPFAAPATVKQGKKVTQKGALITGQSVLAYIAAHNGSARISFRNSDGTMVTATAP